jgi:divalent metal cation (Fe/Co/Zn/Cd) transporter
VEVPPDLSASAMRAIEERIRVRIVSDLSDLDVYAVEVKAAGADVVFCPLLTAIEDSDAEHRISAAEVEMAAREILSADPAVWSVRGVTVHYQDTVIVRVDANICVNPKFTVSEASSLAVKLRENLESSNKIDQANIFLDLNAETLFGTIQESGVFR